MRGNCPTVSADQSPTTGPAKAGLFHPEQKLAGNAEVDTAFATAAASPKFDDEWNWYLAKENINCFYFISDVSRIPPSAVLFQLKSGRTSARGRRFSYSFG